MRPSISQEALTEAFAVVNHDNIKDQTTAPLGDAVSEEKLIESIENNVDWHESLLKLTAKWVGLGRRDSKILSYAPAFTQPGFNLEETIQTMLDMVLAARKKWNKPSPENIKFQTFSPQELRGWNYKQFRQSATALTKFRNENPQQFDALKSWLDLFGEFDSVLLDQIADSGARNPYSQEHLRLVTLAEILESRGNATHWLVDNLLQTSSLSCLFSEPNTGKSFTALDLALSIAAGLPWAGRPVSTGLTVYAAAEAGNSLYSRAQAAAYHHGIDQQTAFALLTDSIDISSDQDVELLIERIYTLEQQTNKLCVFIIIDTFSATFQGNENTAQDVNLYIQKLRKIVANTGAHICVVHHQGHNNNRARGSSALRAAWDTEMQLSAQGDLLTLAVTKQRSGKKGEKIRFRLQEKSFTNPHTSIEERTCVIVSIAETAEAEFGFIEPLNTSAPIALTSLLDAIEQIKYLPEALKLLKQHCNKDKMQRSEFRALCAKNIFEKHEDLAATSYRGTVHHIIKHMTRLKLITGTKTELCVTTEFHQLKLS